LLRPYSHDTFWPQYFDKKICYKKIILRHRFLMINQGKLFNLCFVYVPWFIFFVKSLPWSLDIHGSKLSFHRNMFLLQYCVSKCFVWIRPKRSCSQFHQHFTSSFCFNIILSKNLQRQTVIKEKLFKILSYKKLLVKC